MARFDFVRSHMVTTRSHYRWNSTPAARWYKLVMLSASLSALPTPAAPALPDCDRNQYLAALYFLEATCLPQKVIAPENPGSRNDDYDSDGDAACRPEAASAQAGARHARPDAAAGQILPRRRRDGQGNYGPAFIGLLLLYQRLLPDRMTQDEFIRIVQRVVVSGTTAEPSGSPLLPPDREREFVAAVRGTAPGSWRSGGEWERRAKSAFCKTGHAAATAGTTRFCGRPGQALASVDECGRSDTQEATRTSAIVAPGETSSTYSIPLSGYASRWVPPEVWTWIRQDRANAVRGYPRLHSWGAPHFQFRATAPHFATPSGSARTEAYLVSREEVRRIADQWRWELATGRSFTPHREGAKWVAQWLGYASAITFTDHNIALVRDMVRHADEGEFILALRANEPVALLQFRIDHNPSGQTVVMLVRAVMAASTVLRPFSEDTVHGGFRAALNQLAVSAQSQHMHAIELHLPQLALAPSLRGLDFTPGAAPPDPLSGNRCASARRPATMPRNTTRSDVRYAMSLTTPPSQPVLPENWAWEPQSTAAGRSARTHARTDHPFTFTTTTPMLAAGQPGDQEGIHLQSRHSIGTLMDQWLAQLRAMRGVADGEQNMLWIASQLPQPDCSPEVLVKTQIALAQRMRDHAQTAAFLISWFAGTPVGILQFHIRTDAGGESTLVIENGMSAPATLIDAFQPGTIHGGMDAAIQRLAHAGHANRMNAIEMVADQDLDLSFMRRLGLEPAPSANPAAWPRRQPGKDEL